ncbi:unnamed protein product [Dibothriocephalus latus]|uniref:Uncharacterized protein n=1 Tax=Dibothriocephalus latus TaxID=60516 RepID=A0A3P6SR31_DIBLA|nr:unnamed protein product [Dibothriocephalus latus]
MQPCPECPLVSYLETDSGLLLERPLVRRKRNLEAALDVNHEEEAADQPSAKQQQSRETHEVSRLRLFDQPPLGFPLLLLQPPTTRGTISKNGQWVPFSALRCVTLDPEGRHGTFSVPGRSGVPKGATFRTLVRFWYPPMLNERYITKYPFLLIVQKSHPPGEQKPHSLLQDLAVQLASEHEVVVARVEDWMGAAREVVTTSDPNEEMKLYKHLLRDRIDFPAVVLVHVLKMTMTNVKYKVSSYSLEVTWTGVEDICTTSTSVRLSFRTSTDPRRIPRRQANKVNVPAIISTSSQIIELKQPGFLCLEIICPFVPVTENKMDGCLSEWLKVARFEQDPFRYNPCKIQAPAVLQK